MEKNYKINRLPVAIKIDGIYTIHYFNYKKNFVIQGESHDFWEMVYIDGGEAVITAEKNTFVLRQGEATFHRPNEYHNIRTRDKFASSIILSFRSESAGTANLENRIFTLSVSEKETLQLIVNEAKDAFNEKLNIVDLCEMTKNRNAPYGSYQLIKNYTENLLISLIRKEKSEKIIKKNEKPFRPKNAFEIYERILMEIKRSVYGELNVKKLAAKLFYSETYINMAFKAHTGKSIKRYHTELKINEAKKLISLDKYTISAIAVKLNYSAPDYFCRIFKKVSGYTPKEYSNSAKITNVLL